MRKTAKRNKIVNGKINLAWINPDIEIFFDIPGWPGYKISNKKNVWSEKSHRELKQYKSYKGKPQKHVFLTDFRGKTSSQNVQKLFWRTFYMPRFIENF